MPSAAPSPGQLVQVRHRQFLVQDVHASGLVRDGVAPPQHRVKLSSVEEDALGEELEVIWEIEPGARILHTASSLPAPTGLDAQARFDAFLRTRIASLHSNAQRSCTVLAPGVIRHD